MKTSPSQFHRVYAHIHTYICIGFAVAVGLGFFLFGSVQTSYAAIAFDAASHDAAAASGAVTDFSWTHTPSGTPRGVLVYVLQNTSASEQVNSVTYGSLTLTRVGVACDSAAEPGCVYAYVGTSSIPTGAQTVTVNETGGSGKHASALTFTAARNTQVVNLNFDIQANAANPSRLLYLAGHTSYVSLALFSGLGAAGSITPLSGWTSRFEDDFGAQVGGFYTYDTIDDANVTVGWTQAADDAAMLAVALEEVGQVTLSGTLYEEDGTTPVTTGETVVAAFSNIEYTQSTTTDGSGNFSLSFDRAFPANRWTGQVTAVDGEPWSSITYGNNTFVAVGDSVVMTSADGITWATTTAAGDDDGWRSVTYGNGTFVAVGALGDRVMTSADGITWATTTAAEGDDEWRAVTYGNGTFVAIGDVGDRVMTSPDGITWATTTAAGDDDTWVSITYGNGTFVAVGFGPDRVMTSPDGITWTARSAVGNNDIWYDVAYGNGTFVAVNGASTDRVITSADGITWATTTSAISQTGGLGVMFGNGTFVVFSSDINQGSVYLSSDGINWLVRPTTYSTFTSWNDISYGNGTFVAISSDSIDGYFVMTSGPAPVFSNHSGPATVYIEDAASVAATTLTKLTGSTTYSGVDLYDNTVSLDYSTGTIDPTTDTFYDRDDFADILFDADGATTTIGSTATSAALMVSSGTTFAASSTLELFGDFTNNGSFDPGNSTTIFNGTSQQIATGTLYFYDLTVANASQDGATNQSVIFGAPLTVSNTFTMLPGTSAEFLAGTTSTLQNINLLGTSGDNVYVRSSNGGSYWYLDVPGTQTSVAYVDFKDSYASSTITASAGSTDSGHNVNWTISGSVPSSRIANHVATQTDNAFSFQSKTNEPLFAFKLIPESGTATVTTMVITLSGIENVDYTDFSNIRLLKDNDDDGNYDASDEQVGGAGVMSISEQMGTITFTGDFLATTTRNYIVVANWDAPSNGSFMMIDLLPSGVTAVDAYGSQAIYGAVTPVRHNRNNRGGGGAASDTIGGAPPVGNGTAGGGGQGGSNQGGLNNEGQTIDNDPNFRRPSAHTGSWTTGGNAYDGGNGTYATDNAGATHRYTDHGFVVPGGNSVMGIEVKLELSGTTAAGTVGAALSWDGGNTWTSLKSSPTLTTSDAVISLGGSADTWGRSWSIGEFSNANFAVRLTGAPSSNTVRVDELQVRVYYQTSGGGGGGGGDI